MYISTFFLKNYKTAKCFVKYLGLTQYWILCIVMFVLKPGNTKGSTENVNMVDKCLMAQVLQKCVFHLVLGSTVR